MRNLRILLSLTACLACAFLIGCSGVSTSSTAPNVIASSGANVAPISVNGGPQGNYPDAAFISVTVCVPGTSTCQTVDDILVDTGSPGLRILSSALTVSLPQQKAADGNPVAECLTFLGSYTWGPVQTADVQISGEKASSVPIQVLSDTDFHVPEGCTSSGYPSADTLDTLGANGILGVGLIAQDCGNPCLASYDQYFECPSSGCEPTGNEALSQQVINPVALFAADKNGVIVELPSVSSGGEASLSGSLVFGIGTESNNGLGEAKVYAVPDGALTTTFNSQAYPESFIDSGSNGLFFPNTTGIAVCGGDASGFYCPASPVNLSATNRSSGVSGTVNFTIADAQTIFNADDSAGDLGGAPISGGPSNYFDWGLPFFFGRNVYVAIDGASTPGGVGPYWAY
jgi:Protein of unknown function (DUF3443)